MAEIKMLRVVIFSPQKDAVSETFIKAHIEGLPYNVIPRYGSLWQLSNDAGQLIWPFSQWLGALSRRLGPGWENRVFDNFLAWHLCKIRPNAVLAEYGTTGVYLVEGCKKAKVPLLVHFHGYDASVREVLELNCEAYRNMFDYSTGIVAVSEAMKNRLIALGAPPERLHLNPYGVDPKQFSGGCPEMQAPVFLAVGRFVEKKAPYLTVLAFSKVFKNVPFARLIMVGEGPLLGPCKRLATSLGLDKSIEFLGTQDSCHVSQLMRKARAFLQHSLEAENGDCEGTPVAIIEAQMTGLPVISTRHAGIPDVVVDGETGFIVDEGDANEMSLRMLQLARDPELAGRMGCAARKRAETNYTLDRYLKQLTEMLESGIIQNTHLREM